MRTPVLDVFRPPTRALAWLYFGLRLRDVENIPATGPVLVLANHQTYADPILATIPIHRPVYYMAWNRLFSVPGLGWFIRRLRAFPVDIEGRDRRATRAVIRLLEAGEAVMIFPEGGRSLDGGLEPFKPGAFRLAVSLGVPVLPVTIAGGHESWPPGRALPRPGRMTITYHPLIHPDSTLEPKDAVQRLATATREAITSALDVGVHAQRRRSSAR